jgi:urea transport system ATP-binding protein
MTSGLLELRGITVSFDGFLALRDLNLSLQPGELRAVIGPNGAGKTTFLDVITGKVAPSDGDVLFKGRSLMGRPEHRIARLGIGRKFQSPRVFEQLTVRENLALAVSRPKQPWTLLFGGLRKRSARPCSTSNEHRQFAEAGRLACWGLIPWPKAVVGNCHACGTRSDLLLVDEPVAGLTDEETDLTADLLKSLAGDHTVLVIEHDMEFIRRLDSPVTVLHQGHVLCEGTMDQVEVDPRVIEVYLGTTEEDSK